MKNGKVRKQSVDDKKSGVVDGAEGARRATEAEATTPEKIGPLGPGQRWTAARKREVVLRLLRGESMDAISRELGIEMFILEDWFEKALAGMDANLKTRTDDPLAIERDEALKRIGELTMENELLRMRCGIKRPFDFRRSRK
jgi:transposase